MLRGFGVEILCHFRALGRTSWRWLLLCHLTLGMGVLPLYLGTGWGGEENPLPQGKQNQSQ